MNAWIIEIDDGYLAKNFYEKRCKKTLNKQDALVITCENITSHNLRALVKQLLSGYRCSWSLVPVSCNVDELWVIQMGFGDGTYLTPARYIKTIENALVFGNLTEKEMIRLAKIKYCRGVKCRWRVVNLKTI